MLSIEAADQRIHIENKLFTVLINDIIEDRITNKSNYYKTNNWRLILDKSSEQQILPYIDKGIQSILPTEIKGLYTVYRLKHTIGVKAVIKEANKIIHAAHKAGLYPCIAKGFTLSQIIYDDLYMRQFGDIDLYIDEEHIIKMCKLMEQLGYVDELAEQLNANVRKSNDLSGYYLTRFEMKFMSHDKDVMVEVKFRGNGADRIMMEHFLKTPVSIKIDDFYFQTFDLLHTCLYLFLNTYSNFNSEYGISANFKLRDLVDVRNFLHRYKEFDYKLLYETALKYGLVRIIKYVINLVEGVLGPADDMCGINAYFRETEPMEDIVKWESDLIYRILHPQERIAERTKIKLKTVLDNKTGGYYPIKLPQDCINMKELDFICRQRLVPGIRLYDGNDADMLVDFYIDYSANKLYICFMFSNDIRCDNIAIKIGFPTFNKMMLIYSNTKEGQAVVKHSNIEEAELIVNRKDGTNRIAVSIPTTENDLFYNDTIKKMLLLYIAVTGQGYENSNITLYSWGGKIGPIVCII